MKRRGLQRLLRVRKLEEQQSRAELESVVGNRDEIGREIAEAKGRQSAEWHRLISAADEEDRSGRAVATIAMEMARMQQMRAEPRLKEMEAEVARTREELLTRRVRRRQVEAVLEEELRETQKTSERKAQQTLDDWYGRRTPESR